MLLIPPCVAAVMSGAHDSEMLLSFHKEGHLTGKGRREGSLVDGNVYVCVCVCVCVCVFTHQLFATPWTVARQAPLSMEFSRQKYWSGLPFPSPGDLPNPGIEPMSLAPPALAGVFFITGATREASRLNKNHYPSYTINRCDCS